RLQPLSMCALWGTGLRPGASGLEQRHPDVGRAAAHGIEDGDVDELEAALEGDRLVAEHDLAAVLGVLAEDRIADLAGEAAEQARLQLADEQLRLAEPARAGGEARLVDVLVLGLGECEQVARVERIAAEGWIDRLVGQLGSRRGAHPGSGSNGAKGEANSHNTLDLTVFFGPVPPPIRSLYPA